MLVQAGYLAWVSAAALLLSAVLRRRTDRVVELAEERERLMAEAVSAEERERQALAEALHDTAIQNLLSARHELQEIEDVASSPALERADAALDGHGHAAARGRLRAAPLRARGGRARVGAHAPSPSARRAPAASSSGSTRAPSAAARTSGSLLSAARELLTNVAKHADARQVTLRLRRGGRRHRRLDRGRRPRVRRDARSRTRVARGHIGLASHRARLESVGGGARRRLGVRGRGTRAEIRVPRV